MRFADHFPKYGKFGDSTTSLCATTTAFGPYGNGMRYGGIPIALRHCDYCGGFAAYGKCCDNCGAPDA